MGAILPRGRDQYQNLKIIRSGIVLLVILGFSSLLYSDEDAARIYLKKAKEQVQKKDYQTALATFQKAVEEAPNLPEIYYEQGVMYWQAKEMAEAMKNFNRVSELLKDNDSLSKPLQDIQNKITAYQAEYMKITKEFNDLNQTYLTKFMELADKYQDKGDDYLVTLFNRLLVMDGENKEIKQRLTKIQKVILDQQKEIITSLFDGTSFSGWDVTSNLWKAFDGKIQGDGSDGSYAIHHTGILENNYIFIADVKVEEAVTPEYLYGLVVAFRNRDSFYEYGIFKNRVALIKYRQGKEVEKDDKELKFLGDNPLPEGWQGAEWNNLMVKINGGTISCYLNNDLQFEVNVAGEQKSHFRGSPGLIIQDCKASFKKILSYAE